MRSDGLHGRRKCALLGTALRQASKIRARCENAMRMDSALQNQALATVPSLRAFAMSLCGDADRVNDLVQETLLRAFSHIESFQVGTNMQAWLFTILRNNFREEYRKRRREVEDADGRYAEMLISRPEQPSRVEFGELCGALEKLPAKQRRAVILVGALDFSCDEAAAACSCAAGTIKSRVHRGRVRLADLLAIDGAKKIQPATAPLPGNGS